MTQLHLEPSVPIANEKRIAVRVTPDAVRHIRSGHPWVYDQSITKLSHVGDVGDLAVVFNKDRSFLGIGLFDPDSPIRIKILHAGKPARVDLSFWKRRVETAAERRSALASSVETTGYRCINGENDQMPGLILDRYDSIYVLKLYSAAWIPHVREVLAAIDETYKPSSVVLRLSRLVESGQTFGLVDGQTIMGAVVSGPTTFREHGLVFEVDVVNGQKTGHFLDQRENRAQIGRISAESSVLDVFSCTGGFALHAAAGGAKAVTCVDQSEHALDGAKRNFDLNNQVSAVANCDVSTIAGDANHVLAEMISRNRNFDIVVVDPPSFAQRQSSVAGAVHSYQRLAASGIQLVTANGALFQASCSSRVTSEDFEQAVLGAAKRSGRPFHVVDRFGHADDHPVTFSEGAYLKAVLVRFGTWQPDGI